VKVIMRILKGALSRCWLGWSRDARKWHGLGRWLGHTG